MAGSYIQVVIYLDVPAELCYENAQAGTCEMDKRLPLDFFKRIEQAYKENYFPFAKARGVNIIELDWTKPLPIDEVSTLHLILLLFVVST